jgi:hypothetical protein
MDEKRLERLERAADIVEIQMLQAKYMNAIESMRFDIVLNDIMAKNHPDVRFEMCEMGAFVGPENVQKFLGTIANRNPSGGVAPQPGILAALFIATPRVVFSKDRERARGQWHVFGPHSMNVSPYPGDERKLTAYWFCGKYDNEYIKVDGEWKMLKMHVIVWFRTPYDQGWIKQPDCRRIMPPPDCIPDEPPRFYTYHSDAVYTGDGPWNWGPFLPEDGYEY